jgi:hypothetical protein
MSQVEQLADNVFALIDVEPTDGRSWLPPGTVGFEPFNKYAIVQPEAVLLLDTGVAAHRASIAESLREIVGDRMLILLPTRSELECIGNLGALVDSFPQVQVITTARAVPPLGLAHMREERRETVRASRLKRGERLQRFGFPNLESINPVIRILGTTWIYDHVSRILFTSDFFANDLMTTLSDTVVRRERSGLLDPASLRRSIVAKFDWLERAHTAALEKHWDTLFAEFEPAALAPSVGRIQIGRVLAEEVLALYRQALFGIPPARAHRTLRDDAGPGRDTSTVPASRSRSLP